MFKMVILCVCVCVGGGGCEELLIPRNQKISEKSVCFFFFFFFFEGVGWGGAGEEVDWIML